MSDYFRKTPRIGFRTWTERDLDLACGLWGDPQVTQFIDARARLSREDVAHRLAEEIRCEAEHGVQYWPIFLLATGEHVGCCGLRLRPPRAGIFELGAHLRPSHWRQGLAEEASVSIIAHAFGDLGAHGLIAGHHPRNESSRRLLARLGFRYTHDEPYAPTGLRHPMYLLEAPAPLTEDFTKI